MNKNDESNKDRIENNHEKKPDEQVGFCFSTHLKIFDPNTKEILVKERGDN